MVQIKVSKVAGNVYMLRGAGGNIGASVGEDGIVIVDDQYAPLADKIKAALKGITDKPVRFVINTHYHQDHTGGNAIFQQGAPVIAQDNVRKRLAEGGTAGNLGGIKMEVKPAPKAALPIITFDHDVTVHLNGEDIRAVVEKDIKEGKSLDQLKQENVLAPWQKWSGDFITSEQWLVTLYNDLTGVKTGEFIKHN